MSRQYESERMEKFYTLHPWIQDVLKDRKVVRVIDVCSGVGLAGIAFSKILRDRGFEVNLTLVDLRSRALEKARRFALKELGFEPKTTVLDITNPLNIFERYDVALLWGLQHLISIHGNG